MPLISVDLSRAQSNRLRKGLNIRVSHAGLTGGGSELNVSERAAKRIASAARRGKGLQISAADLEEEIEGGNIGRAFRKAGKSISRGVTKAANTVARETPGALKQASHETGRFVEKHKKYVPKDVVKGAVSGLAIGATALTGNPTVGMAIERGINPAVDSVYATDLSRGSVGKNFAMNYGKALASQEMKFALKGAKAPPKGAGFKPLGSGFVPLGGRLVKGSDEAKAYMASIRAGVRGGRVAAGSPAALQYSEHLRNKTGGKKYREFMSRARTAPSQLSGGSVRSHVARIQSTPNNLKLNLDENSGDFLARRIHGRGFLPI